MKKVRIVFGALALFVAMGTAFAFKAYQNSNVFSFNGITYTTVACSTVDESGDACPVSGQLYTIKSLNPTVYTTVATSNVFALATGAQ